MGVVASLGLATAAQAAPPITLTGHCGQVLTQSRTYILQNDIGPCNSDGLIIGANNLTLDLRRHTVSGIPVEPATGTPITGGVGEGVGIRVEGKRFVVIKSGTVRDFDAGVLLAPNGAGVRPTRNLLTNLTLRGNIGNQEEGGFPPVGPITEFSDGIALLGAPDNVIKNNLVTDNGGGGITLNGGSNANEVSSNQVTGNRSHGIRFPTFVRDNVIHGNNVSGNARNGFNLSFDITNNDIHHNTVDSNSTGMRLSVNSVRNYIAYNTFTNNRREGLVVRSSSNTVFENTIEDNGTAGQFDGITVSGGFVPPNGPVFGNLVLANDVHNNTGNGIRILCTRDFEADPENAPCRSYYQSNRITDNSVTGNGGSAAGTKVFGTGFNEGLLVGYFDLLDGNNYDNLGYPDSARECGSNRWVGNEFDTAYPDCAEG